MRVSPERWQEAGKHFDRLADAVPEDRAAAMSRLRQQDPELADLVQRMLSEDANEAGVLDLSIRRLAPTMVSALANDNPEALGLSPSLPTIDGLVIGPRLGQGGMGEVFRAERCADNVRQTVALKLLRPGLDSGALRERFERERRILASLEHPDIARFVDAGVTSDGRPWLAMEFVDGEPITDHARRVGLDLHQRVALLLRVTRAVAFAQSRLVVHRDLKPSNILIDQQGRPRLLDFGIAKLLEAPEQMQLTQTVLRAFSPAYAAPEQITDGPISTATDVYALGLVLYELLTAQLPNARQSASLLELSQRVLQETTDRPSEVLRKQTGQPESTLPMDQSALRRQARTVSGDLDLIVLTALQIEPTRRYATAQALADDLQAWLDGRPIWARPDSSGYRLRRFIGRHRVGVAAAALSLCLLLAALGSALWQAQRATQAEARALAEARQAQEQAQRAEAVQDFLLDIFRSNSSGQADPIKARETTARELLDIGAERIGSSLDNAPAAKFAVLSVLGELYHELVVVEQAVQLRKQALDLARALHGPQSLPTAKALLDLAASLHASTEVGERASILEQAASILEQHRDPPAELYAEMLIVHAEHYSSSDIPRAITYAEAAVAQLEELPVSLRLASALYTKGLAHNFAGQNAVAAAAFARAVEVSRQVQGDPNPVLPRYYAMLSETQFRMLEIEGARENARLALEAASAVSGSEHVDSLQTSMRLGRLLFDTGATVEGLQYLARARQVALETRGPDDPFHTPQAWLEHGYALVRAGDPEAGLADIQAAIDNRRRNRPDTLYLALMLERGALALMAMGRGDEADAMLDEAAQIRDSVNQPPNSRDRNNHVALRAHRAAEQGQEQLARRWLSEFTLPANPQGPSTDQVNYAVLRAEIAWLLNDNGTAAEAAGAALSAISALGMDEYLAIENARALYVLGQALLASGDSPGACRALQAALEIRQPRLLLGSQQLAETRDAVAAACQ